MLSYLQRAIGAITVDVDGDMVRVKGIPSRKITADITRLWSTSRIAKYLFSEVKGSEFSFHKFFIVDVLYILQKLSVHAGTTTSRYGLKKIIQKLEEATWVGTKPEDVEDILDWSKLDVFEKSPLEHQVQYMEKYNKNVPMYELNGYMLASPAGSGKTLMGLMLKEALRVDILIVVPPKNALNRVWVRALQEEYKEPRTNYWSSIENQELSTGYEFYLCHYESLGKLLDKEMLRHFKNERVMVILDESHFMNEIRSQRTENFVTLCKEAKAEHVLWASGTPLKAMGSEMIPFLRTVDQYFVPDVEERFKKVYGMSTGRANDILANRLGLVSYRVDKSTVVQGEPIEQDMRITIDNADPYTLDALADEMARFISERLSYYRENRADFKQDYEAGIEQARSQLDEDDLEALKHYERQVKQLSKASGGQLREMADVIQATNSFEKNTLMPLMDKETRKRFEKAKSVIKYVELKVRGEALGTVLGRRRIECHVAMLDAIDFRMIIKSVEKKTLIFSSYVDVVKKTERMVSELKFQPVVVFGETSGQIKSLLKKFESEPKANPGIATYQSLSTAVPLISANQVVLLNQPFRDHDRNQAISRVHRLGQDSQVYVTNVLLDTGEKKNVSTRSLDIVEWSRDQVESMMGISDPGTSLEAFSQESDQDINQMWDALTYESELNDLLSVVTEGHPWQRW